MHDPELFPTDEFRECCVRSLSRAQLSQWAPDFEQGDVELLVEQVRQRLLPKRGVFALPEEILITVGSQHACYLLAEALFSERTRLGFEEPGHPHARNSFALRNPVMVDIPVDREGLVLDTLPPVDYVFVTPSHQSPTTHTSAWSAATGCCARPSCRTSWSSRTTTRPRTSTRARRCRPSRAWTATAG
jgi:GntR family transcriptional regulator/MocR family aminotransferase